MALTYYGGEPSDVAQIGSRVVTGRPAVVWTEKAKTTRLTTMVVTDTEDGSSIGSGVVNGTTYSTGVVYPNEDGIYAYGIEAGSGSTWLEVHGTDQVLRMIGFSADGHIVTGSGTSTPGPAGAGVASGGTSGQYLKKDSGTDYDTSWDTLPNDLPTGGTTDQALTKNSNTNYDVEWTTIPTDALVVHKAGTETVTGDKTFSGDVNVPTPTDTTHATTKAYVDTAVATVQNLVNAKGDLLAGSADNTLVRVAAAANGRAVTYDSTQASGLSSATIPSISGLATVAGDISQFADVSANAAVDGDILRYDDSTNEWVPVDITGQFAELDANGRIEAATEPQYYVPTIIINEGDSVPGDFPAGGVVFARPSSGTSLVPVAIGSDDTAAGTTLVITTTQDVEVGDYLVIGYAGSGEAVAPITVSSVAFSVGVCPMTATADKLQGSTIQTQILYGRCTTLIPSGSTITVTVDDSRAEMVAQACKVAGIVVASALDQSGTGGAASGFSFTAGPTGSTGQASEVAFAMFGFNPGGVTPTRTLSGSGGWGAVGSTVQSNGVSERSGLLLYKILDTIGTVTATATLTGPDSPVWAGSVATLKVA